MTLISRNIISENFLGIPHDRGDNFNKSDLVEKINLWKYALRTKCHAKHGESILIGLQLLNIDYLAVCFAAAELGLKIVIIDYSRNDDFRDLTYYDPKTKILSPIDIFLHDFPKNYFIKNPKALSKFIFFSGCSLRTYSIFEDIDFSIDDREEFEKIKDIFPSPSDIVMRCTSSGTTGTPKIVEHSHEFLYMVSKRNSFKFKGECLHVRNLNHGSSLAVYLLPSLISDLVSAHVFYDLDETQPLDAFVCTLREYSSGLEYVIFPYPFMIEGFIESSRRNNIKWPLLNLQTLSYIQDKAKEGVKDGLIKSITSIFGSNETSGPIFISYIDKQNTSQDSSIFYQVDDFYKIEIDDVGLLKVKLPVYNNEIITNDVFEQQDIFYRHKGRSDLIRINGEVLDIKILNELNTKNDSLYVVTDTINNCLYLAFWKEQNISLEQEYKDFFSSNFKNIKIDKIAVLDKKKFLSGIKLDNELLREYFRTYV